MRTDLIRLWLTVALAGVLTIATVAEFWTATPSDRGSVATDSGGLLFQAKGCSGCHTIAGLAEFASIGPDLTHLSRVADERIPGMDAEAYVTQSIRDPQAFTVPNFGPYEIGSIVVAPAAPAAITSGSALRWLLPLALVLVLGLVAVQLVDLTRARRPVRPVRAD